MVIVCIGLWECNADDWGWMYWMVLENVPMERFGRSAPTCCWDQIVLNTNRLQSVARDMLVVIMAVTIPQRLRNM